jgi:hypothetical protein
LGGVITQHSTWRWIYLFNAPFASVGVLPIIGFWPKTTSNAHWRNFDIIGGLSLITASSLLIFVLNQAGAYFFAWSDAVIVSCATISAVSWTFFVVWTMLLSYRPFAKIDPIFPGRVAASRPTGPLLM